MKISGMAFNLHLVDTNTWWKWLFNIQREITPKADKPELQFMCSAVVSWCFTCVCVKFCDNIMNGIRVMEWTQIHGRNGYVHCSKSNNSKKYANQSYGSCVLHIV